MQAYGHKCFYLLAEEESNVVGIFPLCYFRIPFLGSSLISLPFCDAGGVHSDNLEVQNHLIHEALRLAQELKVLKFEIRSFQNDLLDSQPGRQVDVQTEKVSMLLDLPDSSGKLWEGFKSKLRSQVKKAEKNGLCFTWDTEGSGTNDFYQVFCKNMHDLGSPVHSRKWIEKVVENYGNNSRIGLVYHGNQPIGCGIILFTNHTVCIPWASTLRQFNSLMPNMLLYWSFLEYAADNGFSRFDFGRSTIGEGTFRFKKQWGAEAKQLFWYQVRGTQIAQKNVVRNDRGRASKMWKKIPQIITNLIGPKLRKYISL